jgi:anti-sigma regulatory factor (Ser/Thr protein kinase)
MREGGAGACLAFSFPASPAALAAARKRVVEGIGAVEGERSERWLFEWKLVVSEALSNAVEHGSPGGAGDPVTVEVFPEGEGVWLAVRQRGPVKAEGVMEPEGADGKLRERGRGLSLIGQYSGAYFWRELDAGGGELRVWKPFAAGSGEKAGK